MATKKKELKGSVEQRLGWLESGHGTLRKTQLRLESEMEVIVSERRLLLENYAAFRKVLLDLITSFEQASNGLKFANTYTQDEVTKMTAEEYREKILIPLGMGKK